VNKDNIKIGDKVIWIKHDSQMNFTSYKEYSVFDVYSDSKYNIVVQNDYGFLSVVGSDYFISIKKYRKQKLEKICLKQEIK